MRLVLFDRQTESRINFYPVALCRPIWELRWGMTTLGDKLIVNPGAEDASLVALDRHTGKIVWRSPGEPPQRTWQAEWSGIPSMNQHRPSIVTGSSPGFHTVT